MITHVKSSRGKMILVAAVAVAGISASAARAADVLINDYNDVSDGLPFPLLSNGNLAPISYVRPIGDSAPVLTVRPGAPLFCARRAGAAVVQSDVVVDVNGYDASFSLAGRSYTDRGAVTVYETGQMFRAADRIPMEGATYDNQFVLTVDEVDGYCWLGLEVDQPGDPLLSVCEDAGQGVSDVLHRAGFDAQGSLNLTTTVFAAIPPVGSGDGGVYYRHVLTATGGRVDGIQLREQFPYYYESAPVFRDSLALNSSWHCQAGNGGFCSGAAGRGYMALDGLSLEAGSCLVVESARAWRRNGAAGQDLVTGRIHAAAHAPSGSGGAVATQTSITFSN